MSPWRCCRQVTIGLRLVARDKRAFPCSVAITECQSATTAHTDGLLVASAKVVVVCRFEEPAEAVFAGWPEHEVSRQLTGYGVGRFPILLEVNPFGTDAQHELCPTRYGPRFFEEQVGVPFRRITRVEGC
jgi:hypothetical protein